jgi:Uma2 family endonuclease
LRVSISLSENTRFLDTLSLSSQRYNHCNPPLKTIMVQTPLRPLILDEFLSLPETKPASEYINGTIIQKPMPQGKHSRLQRKLIERINITLDDAGIAEAFPELRCTFGGRSIVPDIAIFQLSHIPTDATGEIANRFNLPPDWTIEILSPNQSSAHVIHNILHCLQNGCEMGWFVDPADQSVTVYPKGQQPTYFNQPSDRLSVPDFAQTVALTMGELLSWLQVR